jgi:hypothetical protein
MRERRYSSSALSEGQWPASLPGGFTPGKHWTGDRDLELRGAEKIS